MRARQRMRSERFQHLQNRARGALVLSCTSMAAVCCGPVCCWLPGGVSVENRQQRNQEKQVGRKEQKKRRKERKVRIFFKEQERKKESNQSRTISPKISGYSLFFQKSTQDISLLRIFQLNHIVIVLHSHQSEQCVCVCVCIFCIIMLEH